jgi:hypothetical protein
MSEAISIVRGDPLDYIVELRRGDYPRHGEPITGVYTGSEPLSARLWAGDDRAPEAAPEVVWEDPAAGLIALTLDTSPLDRGIYKVEVLLAGSPCWSGRLQVLAAPGEAPPPPAYATYDGMIRRGGEYLPTLQGEAAQAAYAEERHDAWLWTHRQVMARMQDERDRLGRGWRAIPHGPELRSLLDAGALVMTPEIVEANEHYAVAMVLRRVVTRSGGNEPSVNFGAAAAWHQSRANAILAAAELDIAIPPDEPDEPIPDPD